MNYNSDVSSHHDISFCFNNGETLSFNDLPKWKVAGYEAAMRLPDVFVVTMGTTEYIINPVAVAFVHVSKHTDF